MHYHRLSGTEFGKAVGVGIATGILLSLIAIAGQMSAMSPMPEPLGLAFARLILGPVPMPVGLLFHLVYVTVWTVVYVVLFRSDLTLVNALGLGLFLWLLVLIAFFPLVGWGVFGLEVGPQLIVAALVLHLLFSLFIWGLSRLVFRS